MVIGGASGWLWPILNHGTCWVSGSSRRSLPASRSWSTAVLVKSLLMEAILYSVSGVARSPRSRLAWPNPRAQISSWSCRMPIERPGQPR